MKYVVALGFLAVVVGVYAYTSLFSVDMPATTETEAELVAEAGEVENGDNPFTGAGTLEGLRLWGTPIECTISYQADTGELVEGTFFSADSNMRGDFLVDTPDLSGKMLSSLIYRDDVVMVWSELDGVAQGIKMDTATFAGDDEAANEPVAMDVSVDYRCAAWSPVDNSIFEEPSDVLFYDFNELMNSGMEYGTIYETGAEMP